jgi:hypothetical protein
MEEAAGAGVGPLFVVLSHSARMDMVADPASSTWTDQEDRPWDPPITDYDLPRYVFEQQLPAFIRS